MTSGVACPRATGQRRPAASAAPITRAGACMARPGKAPSGFCEPAPYARSMAATVNPWRLVTVRLITTAGGVMAHRVTPQSASLDGHDSTRSSQIQNSRIAASRHLHEAKGLLRDPGTLQKAPVRSSGASKILAYRVRID